MLIDPIVPRILQARGLSRRDAAAALRAHHESHRYASTPEATHLIQHALGSPRYSDGEYGEDKYDIAIGKGVRLVERSARGLGIAMQNPNRPKAGTFVVIDRTLPATAATALLGKELHHLIDHPLLPRDAAMLDIKVLADRTEVEIHSPAKELSVLLPASQEDLELARRSWVRMRRDQVREAGADHRMTPSIRRSAAKGAIVPAVLALLLSVVVWAATDADHAAPRVAAILASSIVAAWTWRRALRRMRRAAEAEDGGLLPRLDDLRARLVMERRETILEGRGTP